MQLEIRQRSEQLKRDKLQSSKTPFQTNIKPA